MVDPDNPKKSVKKEGVGVADNAYHRFNDCVKDGHMAKWNYLKLTVTVTVTPKLTRTSPERPEDCAICFQSVASGARTAGRTSCGKPTPRHPRPPSCRQCHALSRCV
jgi:hypothetical protein